MAHLPENFQWPKNIIFGSTIGLAPGEFPETITWNERSYEKLGPINYNPTPTDPQAELIILGYAYEGPDEFGRIEKIRVGDDTVS